MISQRFVYADPGRNPIFSNDHQKTNISFLLHIANFFTHHLTCKEEYTLYDSFTSLNAADRPHAWTSRLEQGTIPMGKHWVSVEGNCNYSCLCHSYIWLTHSANFS